MRVLSQLKSRFGLPWLVSNASAAQPDVTPTSMSAAIPERAANCIVKVRANKKTGNFRLLDYALAVIADGSPDPGDFAQVPVLRRFSDLIGYPRRLGLKRGPGRNHC